MKRILFVLCMLVLLLPSVFAGGSQEKSDEITLKWQIWITPNLTRDFYEDVATAFEQEHPGVDVELIEVSATGSSNAIDFIRNRIAAGDIPDVWTNVGDVPNFADKGHLWALPTDDPDLKQVRDVMGTAYEGKVYSLNSHIQPQGIMFYNKALWEECGLTSDDIPYTWENLYRVSEIIKQAGYTPIATGGEWVPLIFFDYLVAAELTKEQPDFWTQVYEGKKKWNNPQNVEILQFVDTLVKNGYIIDGALSIGYAQLEQTFLSGKAVMYPMGSWFTAAEAAYDKDWETGAFSIPTKDGRTNLIRSGVYGNSLVISSASEHPELAFELVKKMCLDPVFGSRYIEADGLYSNLDPPLSYDMSPLQEELLELVSSVEFSQPLMHHRMGAAAPPGIADYFTSAAEAILSQSYKSLEDLLIQIDTFVEEIR